MRGLQDTFDIQASTMLVPLESILDSSAYPTLAQILTFLLLGRLAAKYPEDVAKRMFGFESSSPTSFHFIECLPGVPELVAVLERTINAKVSALSSSWEPGLTLASACACSSSKTQSSKRPTSLTSSSAALSELWQPLAPSQAVV